MTSERMAGEKQENVYYFTSHATNYYMSGTPEGARCGIRKGIYKSLEPLKVAKRKVFSRVGFRSILRP